MPTVLRFDGLRAVIYPNDHRPAHVHVIGKGGEAVFILHCPNGPPELRESYRFNVWNRASLTRFWLSLARRRFSSIAAFSAGVQPPEPLKHGELR